MKRAHWRVAIPNFSNLRCCKFKAITNDIEQFKHQFQTPIRNIRVRVHSMANDVAGSKIIPQKPKQSNCPISKKPLMDK